jgi:hypothetical protein
MIPPSRRRLVDRFAGPTLDLAVWVPAYLPHWSSFEQAAATWQLGDGGLLLSIPPEHPRWCPDRHAEPLRVSAIQSGSRSGPAGSTDGPQPFREGLTVREAQPTLWGFTPHHGRVSVRMRAQVDDASMFAFWLAGIEDQAARSGEICVAEVFGSGIRAGRAEVGVGIHRFRDPALRESFRTCQLVLDPTVDHDYAVAWSPTGTDICVDGQRIHEDAQSPDYPMQLMIGLFDFPARRSAGAAPFMPRLWVSRVVGVSGD